MEPVVLLDAAGRRRSVATLPGHRCGQALRNKGMRYPVDPPTVEEIVLVMRHAGDRAHGLRLRGPSSGPRAWPTRGSSTRTPPRRRSHGSSRSSTEFGGNSALESMELLSREVIPAIRERWRR